MTIADLQWTNFDSAKFLSEYWQKKPLLIKNAWQRWTNPLDPDELAGLGCENGVESRLITQGRKNLELEEGPLPETRFGQLGTQPWTLLVQSVDQHIPAVAALLEPFRFIPNWRVDDVMVSYAVDGGGVGPHFDQYDVFLVQGLGRRLWQLGGICDEHSELVDNSDLRLLANFEPSEEWILGPGDILYVPPRVAHNGIAMGDDCMTYSIGFRAPSCQELVTGWTESLVSDLDDDDRYADPDLSAQENPGEISSEAIDRLHGMVLRELGDRDRFANWFGQFTTQPKNAEIDWQPEEPVSPGEVRDLLALRTALIRNPASRFSFIRHSTDETLLFVDGQRYPCSGQTIVFAELLCANDRFEVSPGLDASTLQLLVELLNQGSIAFAEDD